MSDNNWLKYNSSEYTVNGITYRNLEAQVLKNKEDIEAFDISGLEDDVEQLQTDVAGKQDKLTAGPGISISTENEISATVVGIPEGGTTGQVLTKVNGDDFNVTWANGGGGGTPEVLWCTTSTTYAEITAALAAQQLPVLYAVGRIYTFLEDPTTTSYRFVAVDPSTMDVRYYDVNTSNVWTGSHKSISELKIHVASIILYAADWTSAGGGTYYDMNVACTGMTASAAMTYSAIPSQIYDMAEYGIICTSQYANSLDFRTKGTDRPTGNITVNVVWWT